MTTQTTLTSSRIRQQFIDYFVEKRAHTFAPSSPVVPHDDPTLLFTNAGMNQFKPIFLGQADPSSDLGRLKRAANSQKCIRAGGKHNDLEDVGKDFYHHTFFEMLGNWSFGDYFKAEAIEWAMDLLVNEWGLDPERLYATYFEGNESEGLEPDEEARELWLRHLPGERVLPGDMKDNFWEMGDTGPCGPCSELHYDGRSDDERGRMKGADLVNRDHPDVIEVWNLVFIQFNRTEAGAAGLRPLPAKHVDTGMGLERITRILQHKQSNYDTDLFTPLFARIQELTGAAPYGGSLESPQDTAYRVIADHIRTLVFAITDGADPSNEGRGYVLRRILRRAYWQGRQHLGAPETFLADLAPAVVDQMGGFFPELHRDPKRVRDVIRDEETSFGRTLERGIELFEDYASDAGTQAMTSSQEAHTYASRHAVDVAHGPGTFRKFSARNVDWTGFQGPKPRISAEGAFKLHDTYGFPIDLTQIMAAERGLEVDVEGFERLMDEARERSRAAGAGEAASHPAASLPADAAESLQGMGVRATDDSAKHTPARVYRATVRAIWNGRNFDDRVHAGEASYDDLFAIVLDKTNFYAEAGGQVGDTGSLSVARETRSSARDAHEGGAFEIEDTRSSAGLVLHVGRIKRGEVRVGDTIELRLDAGRRQEIMANHTSTHLLNFALRETLGDHVDQKGSLVAPDRLRFDFSHTGAVTADQAARIESQVREAVEADLPVFAEVAPLETAQSINGLRAVFGEAYPDPVRVVAIGAPVGGMLQNPADEQWRRYSVEFCGGTHLQRTSEAEAFALTDEEAVAKGVRRIVAVTGDVAKAAIERGADVERRLNEAESAEPRRLPELVASIATDVEGAVMPLAIKASARTRIAALQDRVKQVKKQSAAAGRDEAVAAARTVAAEASGTVIATEIPAGADRQALLAAMDVVRAKHEHSAIILFSADAGEGKVAIAAQVPKPLIDRGLKAGDWVREAASACGGKGGGRPDSAQGGGTEPEKVEAAIEAARQFARQRLGE